MTRLIVAAATAPTLALVVSLTGCTNPMDVSYGAIAAHPTPELQGTAERSIDVDRNLSYMSNSNWRSFSDDLGRTFYTDQPSRLSPYPIVYPSGVPR